MQDASHQSGSSLPDGCLSERLGVGALNLPLVLLSCGRLDCGQTYGPNIFGFPLKMALTLPAAPDLTHLQQRHKSLGVVLKHKFFYLSYLTSG